MVGNREAADEEAFGTGLLEYPLYTRPAEWQDRKVPEVLSSGHDGKIKQWRQEQAEEITKNRRPDLWDKYLDKRNDTKLGQ